MNYRHAFHAGNFADVIKHVALVALLMHLRRKDKPFCVIDTHAGAGLYDLGGPEAVRTGEAAEGVGRLAGLVDDPQLPEALRVYLGCVRQEVQGRYPGSSRIAARLLRPGDRLIAVEKHPGAAEALHHSLAKFRNARVIEGDAYEKLFALLPPHERRGLILIDPPYEAENEFARVADVVRRAHRRFATGIYLVWYPVKSRADADALCGEVVAHGIGPILRVEIDIGHAPDLEKERLSAAGVLVVNPPYGFDAEMRNATGVLSPCLGLSEHSPARVRIETAFR